LESRREGKPEGPKRHEDDKWESIAEEELEESADDHEETAKEVINASVILVSRSNVIKWLCIYSEAAPLPPAPRQPIKSQDKGVRLRRKPNRALSRSASVFTHYICWSLQGSWVAKRLPQVTFYGILRRQIYLLKKFRRD
jgi:hypothetical protein